MLIDSHAHLDNEKLKDIEEEIIKNFKKDNVKLVVNASCDVQTCHNSINLINSNKNIYAMLGIHPECANEYNGEFEEYLRINLKNEKVIAVGEIGLDYHEKEYDAKLQKEVFLKQAKIANENNLPVAIHLRDAYGDFLEIIKDNQNLFNNGMLLHCFSGSIEFAKQVMQLIPNTYFAFGGSCTFKNAKNIKETIKEIPIERILSETDCPYLTPEPLRGKVINQPKLIKYIVLQIADVKEISQEKMEQIIENNFYRFFKKIKASV